MNAKPDASWMHQYAGGYSQEQGVSGVLHLRGEKYQADAEDSQMCAASVHNNVTCEFLLTEWIILWATPVFPSEAIWDISVMIPQIKLTLYILFLIHS